MTEAAAPFLKWVGGKRKLLGELVARAPHTYRRYRRYFEPFVGGGALFFRLRPKAAVLADWNPELIACYQAVRHDVEAVLRVALRLQVGHGEDHYYQVRERWNKAREVMSAEERAATFIYLNKTCYNGLWRVNRSGAFNVPAGRYKNPTVADPEALRAASVALGRAQLKHAPFEAVLDEAEAGDLVYFDPPYDPVGPTADFTSYTTEQFGSADQARLADVFRELDGRGCAVMLSNSDTAFVRRLYAGYRIDRVFAPRAINSRADGRGAVAEVIVTTVATVATVDPGRRGRPCATRRPPPP